METPINAKIALLMALVQGKGYGLELIARVKERTSGKIALHDGSVYPALRALERDGLVRSYDGESAPQRGGRPRRYYEITADGLRAARGQADALAPLFAIAGAAPR